MTSARDPSVPIIARASAAPLPPPRTWCPCIVEAWRERCAIASEGGAVDARRVATLDMRAMVARGDLVCGCTGIALPIAG